MESKEGLISGVTVIAADDPSSYHMAPRTNNSIPATGTSPVTPFPLSSGFSGSLEKKKRGRPRKYGPNGAITMAISPRPISSSPPSAAKHSQGRPMGFENKPRHRVASQNIGEAVAYSSGGNFTPHVITVDVGEDITMKILSFSQNGPRAICVISAVGLVSNVTLLQHDSSGGTLTYEGRFEILSLSGSFTSAVVGGSRVGRSGGMSVALASPDGRVVGGLLAGLLIAASPVQVVVGSFLTSNHYVKYKKQKTEPKPTSIATNPGAVPHTSDMEHKSLNPQDQNNSAAGNSNVGPSSTLHTDSWATMRIVQEPRKSSTDMNKSLQGE